MSELKIVAAATGEHENGTPIVTMSLSRHPERGELGRMVAALNNAARVEAAIALADASVEGHEYRDGWSQCPFCLWVAGRDWDPVHDCEMEQYVALVRATEDVTPAPTEGE